MSGDKDFDPRIVGFLCNWCSYAAADLCGVSRYQYPTNVRIIRVMCSARVDPVNVLEMLIQGADAVFVGGCHIGDCHYISGNFFARRRMEMLHYLLEAAGMDPRRLRLEWISASEGKRFADVMTEYIAQVKEMGPNPAMEDRALLENLHLAKRVAADFRLRALTTKGQKVVEESNVYGKTVPEETYKEILRTAVEEELLRAKILLAISGQARSVEEISESVAVPAPTVLEHIVDLKDKGMIFMASMQENIPYYQASCVVEIPAEKAAGGA